MEYLHVLVGQETGQVVNDLAELAGCDYSPILGALCALGLYTLGNSLKDLHTRRIACLWLHEAATEARMGEKALLGSISRSL